MFPKLTSVFVWGAMLSQLFMAPALPNPDPTEPTKELLLLLDQIDPVEGNVTLYTKWPELVKAAKIVQAWPSNTVVRAVTEVQERTTEYRLFDQYKEDQKLLLLMRMMFDLPEHYRVGEGGWQRRFAGYVTYGKEINDDGTINLAWPVAWNSGQPNLVSGIGGLQGVNARYKAAAEFKYFSGKYPRRNLSTFKLIDGNR